MDAAALNTVDLETLRTWRSEAIAAHRQLALGKRLVAIAHAEGRMQYEASQGADLDRWISALEAAICARESGTQARRGPIYPGFGF